MSLELNESQRRAMVLEVVQEALDKIDGIAPALGKPKEGGIEHNPHLHEGPQVSGDSDMTYCPNCCATLALHRVVKLLGVQGIPASYPITDVVPVEE